MWRGGGGGGCGQGWGEGGGWRPPGAVGGDRGRWHLHTQYNYQEGQQQHHAVDREQQGGGWHPPGADGGDGGTYHHHAQYDRGYEEGQQGHHGVDWAQQQLHRGPRPGGRMARGPRAAHYGSV